MLGWMILFALLVVPGFIVSVSGNSVQTSIRFASILFACLFLVGLLTRAARGRT
jgi:hypothetical protein